MSAEEWQKLQAGSIVTLKSKKPRTVLKYSPASRCITLKKASGMGETVYCNGDKKMFTLVKY